MKQILSFVFVGSVLFTGASSAYAKGSPDLIVITGGGLAQPIEITERETLKGFDPWMGQFINWARAPVAEPSDPSRSYEVFFFMKWPGRHSNDDRGDLKMIYSVRYCPGRDGGPGLIYLPGEIDRDDRYSVNTRTILREGDDGKWHQASAAWDSVMKRLT